MCLLQCLVFWVQYDLHNIWWSADTCWLLNDIMRCLQRNRNLGDEHLIAKPGQLCCSFGGRISISSHPGGRLVISGSEFWTASDSPLVLIALIFISTVRVSFLKRKDILRFLDAERDVSVVKSNLKPGDIIHYVLERRRTLNVSRTLHSLLPDVSPMKNRRFKTCAVVGNSGILLNSGCGREIDDHDFVIR